MMNINNQEEGDHLSLIKAAAWAWHQHGSDKSVNVPESELTRAHNRRTRLTAPRPTRYKLEAESSTPDRDQTRISSSSLLLDLYEIERITMELESLIGSGGKKRISRPKRSDKKVNGFWMCRSTRNDVVEAAAVLDGRRRRGKARAVA